VRADGGAAEREAAIHAHYKALALSGELRAILFNVLRSDRTPVSFKLGWTNKWMAALGRLHTFTSDTRFDEVLLGGGAISQNVIDFMRSFRLIVDVD